MANKTERVIFIDRDGVINEDPIGDYVKRWKDFRFIPGAVSALKQLSDAGFKIVILSNQAGIGDGVYTELTLNEITRNMLSAMKEKGIEVSGIYYCLHGKKEGCACRKPKTGLFRQAANDHTFDPTQTYFIGDKATDVLAGTRYGLRTLFVLTGHGEKDRPKLKETGEPEQIFPSISEAAEYALGKPGE